HVGRMKLKEEGFYYIDEKTFLENIKEKDIVIVDRYDLNKEFIDELKDKNIFIIRFDDNNLLQKYDEDIVLNQNIHSEDFNYNLNDNTKLLNGGKYALLREEFLKSEKIFINKEIENIMVTVGGSDHNNLTDEIIRRVDGLNYNIHIIIGKAFKYKDILKETFRENKNIHFYENPIMSEIMEKCDVCISACGSTIYELCYLGIPTIGLVVAENQKLLGEYLNKNEIIVLSEISDIREKIKKLKYEKRIELNIKMKKIVDGKGKERVIDEILKRYKKKFEI
ncbi:MAG: UDP-2,4-diacetamido-2,4,6-trideoxy-beta-L-altropyranose hydrolase, partial [Clostridium sp.]